MGKLKKENTAENIQMVRANSLGVVSQQGIRVLPVVLSLSTSQEVSNPTDAKAVVPHRERCCCCLLLTLLLMTSFGIAAWYVVTDAE